jgi:hypothetical protein
MIVQDAPKREARIRRKCGLEGTTHPSTDPPLDGEEQDEEGRGLLSGDAMEICERDIDEALANQHREERQEESNELDETA